MKELTLRPYPGKVLLCATKKEYRREHKRLFKEKSPPLKSGRCDGHINGTFLVWASDGPGLAHELGHVIFTLFGMCGINPTDSQGEAFCYLLSQLILDSGGGQGR